MLLLLSLLLLANKSWKSLLRRNLAQLTHSSSHPPHALNKTARFKRTQATMKIGKFRSFLRLLFSPSIWALSRVTMKTRCHASAKRRVLVYTHVWRWKWSDSMNKCWVRNIFMAVDSFTLSKKRKKYIIKTYEFIVLHQLYLVLPVWIGKQHTSEEIRRANKENRNIFLVL